MCSEDVFPGDERLLPSGVKAKSTKMASKPCEGSPTNAALSALFLRLGMAPRRCDHPPVMTLEESDRMVPPLPGCKTKNLFLRDKKGTRHFLVTVPARHHVDLAALSAVLGAGRLSFASPERLQRYLEITPGAVSLLALVNDREGLVEFVIDRTVWEGETVQAHPLVNTATLVLSHDDLEKFLTATGHEPRVVEIPMAR